MIKTAASILSADFCNLEKDIRKVEAAGVDYLHIDIMDGLFVPNLTIGMPVVSAIRNVTKMPLDVHLMIDRPLRYVGEFCDAGADILTLHVEADSIENNIKSLKLMREKGVRAAASIKPGTPVSALDPYWGLMDMVLVMTVEPGFGGQKFMADMMEKVKVLRERIDREYPDMELEVDGGVNSETCRLCREAGADVLVAGSAMFKAADMSAFNLVMRGSES